MHCPKCDADIDDTYEGPDPDVGLFVGGWYCEACDLFISDFDMDDGSDNYKLDEPGPKK